MQGLNFARPMEPHATPVEINALVRDVIETLHPRFNNTDVSPILELDENLPQLYLDANQMEQAFIGANYQCTRGDIGGWTGYGAH